MTIGYLAAVRNTRLNAIRDAIDAGAGAGFLRIYDGTRPATGAAITSQVLLAELTFSDPSFPAASAGVDTANAITQDPSANASGTATWFRVVDSTGGIVMDGAVAASGSDLNLTTTAITIAQPVQVTSFVLTAGNP